MTSTFLAWHLGLGDAILCNGLVRGLLERMPKDDCIVLPVKPHNFETVRHLFLDLGDRVRLIQCEDIQMPIMLDSLDRNKLHRVVRLGYWSGNDNFLVGPNNFCQEMYRQAGVPYEYRWEKFKCFASNEDKFLVSQWARASEYDIICDDAKRGYSINRHDPTTRPEIRPSPVCGNLFAWSNVIRGAKEIHAIDSSIACWIDSDETLPSDNLHWHKYARPQEDERIHPKFRKPWKVIL